jgi:hypothetical protein
MKKECDVLIRLLGLVLLTGAVLKGWQLLTEPVANVDLWSKRLFLIFVVEFELALSVWLLFRAVQEGRLACGDSRFP